MAQTETYVASRPAPSRVSVFGLLSLTCAGYGVFLAQGYGEDLYQWSKTLAPFSVRQYLDMSKRYALQYGHLVFLLVILFCSKYMITGESTPRPVARFIAILRPHSMPVFLFHVPFLYFFAALWNHDPGNPWHVTALAGATLLASVIAGHVCFALKRYFDRLEIGIGRTLNSSFPERHVIENGVGSGKPLAMTRSYSDFVHVLQILAMATVFVGHLTYTEFSTWEPPGISAWRRWAVPFFFIVSGYMAMMSYDRRPLPLGDMISKRVFGMWYMVIPMLLLTPILDNVGFALSPGVYMENEKFFDPVMGTGGPADLTGFLITFLNSAFFLNEVFVYKLAEFGTPIGGMRAFSNDAFWFLCYLVPYMLMLTVVLKVRGAKKHAILACVIIVSGPPIMLLAPLFFGGCFVYLLHRRFDSAAPKESA